MSGQGQPLSIAPYVLLLTCSRQKYTASGNKKER
jgi:hypothetical protein